MKLPNLKLASEKCCATCKWFKVEDGLMWCECRPPYEEWMGREEYEGYEIMFDDFCHVREGRVKACDNWEAKE